MSLKENTNKHFVIDGADKGQKDFWSFMSAGQKNTKFRGKASSKVGTLGAR